MQHGNLQTLSFLVKAQNVEFMRNYLRLMLCPGSAFMGTLGAMLLAGKPPDLWLCLAAFLVTFAVYTLDRLKGSAEDAINNPYRVKVFLGREKIFMNLIAGAFIAAILITALTDIWKVPYVLVPVVAGLTYTVEIKGHRVKDILAAKNVIVGLSWGTLEAGLAGAGWSIFAFFLLWAFNNSAICDIRDIAGDRLCGVRTIPAMFGAGWTRSVLLILATNMWFLLPFNGLSFCAISYGYALIVLPFNEWLVDGDWLIIMGGYLLCRMIIILVLILLF